MDPRLSQIETQWTLLFQAHAEESEETNAARAQIIARYSDAIQRYLMACLRDPDALEHELIDLNLWQYCRSLLRPSESDE